MADPLSITASVIALVQLTEKLITLGYTYLGGVKGASNDLRELVDELQSLGNVLITLQDYVQADKNLNSTALQSINGQNGPLPGCALELRRLQLRLEPKQGLKGMIQSLKWPLKEAETLQRIARIQRQKNLFILALTIDNLALSKAIEAYMMELECTTEEINVSTKDTNIIVHELKTKLEAEAEAQSHWRQKQESIQMMETREKILDWIYPDKPDKKHLEINSRRRKNTGDWLIRTYQFQELLNARDPKLLWGYGIPGAGKTFLSSAVIDHLQKEASTKNYRVAYVYFDYKEQDSQTPTNVIASLVKQLSIRLPGPLVREIEEMHKNLRPQGKRPCLEDLYKALCVLLKPPSCSHDQVFLIFDALDECHQGKQRTGLLPIFHRLVEDGARIFITSRQFPEDIQESFKDSKKIELLAKEVDIRTYIQEKIDESPGAKRRIGDGIFKEKILSELTSCAKGMFLLVKFHVEYICQQATRKQIQDALEKLKSSSTEKKPLSPTYDRVMKSIYEKPESCIQLAIKVLSWLVHAQRTLTVKEIQTAVSVELFRYDIDEQDLPDRATLLEVCASLVTIDDHGTRDTIRLAHYTVQDYLQQNSIIPSDAGFTVTMTCATFLSFDRFASGACTSSESLEERHRAYPFLEYAAINLSFHLDKLEESKDLITYMLLRFLAKPGSVFSYLQILDLWDPDKYYKGSFRYFGHYPKRLSPLHIAASLGACEVIRLLIEGADFTIPGNTGWERVYQAASRKEAEVVRLLLGSKAAVAAKDDNGMTAYLIAARKGHKEAVKLLLEKGSNISERNNSGYTALHIAAERGYSDVVKLLLEQGADISERNNFEQTALYIAAGQGHSHVVKLLLEQGADILERNIYGQTALHIAAERDRSDLVKLLLEEGADISERDNFEQTALYIAAGQGHSHVVNLLLEQGAGITERDNDGQTALHIAALQGHSHVVKLLLEQGADISGRDNYRQTALHLAAHQGHSDLVELLLEQGADISGRDNYGWTVLHIAAKLDRSDVVNLLLEQGADISERDDDGQTVLHLAAKWGCSDLVKLLLEQGAGITERDNDGQTALHIAAKWDRSYVVNLLLEQGAGITERDNDGRRALHLTSLSSDTGKLLRAYARSN